jgi:predicted DNA-binding transcriptional regulator AlpA
MPRRQYIRRHRQQRPAQPPHPAQAPLPNRLLDAAEACAMLRMSRTTLYGLALRGEGPVSIKVGARRYWSLYAIQEYIARLEEEARGDYTPT